MSPNVLLLAVLVLLVIVLLVALRSKGDVKTSVKVPFLGSFSLEAKDRRRVPPQLKP